MTKKVQKGPKSAGEQGHVALRCFVGGPPPPFLRPSRHGAEGCQGQGSFKDVFTSCIFLSNLELYEEEGSSTAGWSCNGLQLGVGSVCCKLSCTSLTNIRAAKLSRPDNRHCRARALCAQTCAERPSKINGMPVLVVLGLVALR